MVPAHQSPAEISRTTTLRGCPQDLAQSYGPKECLHGVRVNSAAWGLLKPKELLEKVTCLVGLGSITASMLCCFMCIYIYNYNIYIYIFISRLVDQNHGLIPCKSQPAASSSSWPILCIWQFLANAEPVSSPWMPHYAHHEGSSIYISSPIHSASQDNPGLIRRIHLPGRQSFVCSPSQQPSGLRTRGWSWKMQTPRLPRRRIRCAKQFSHVYWGSSITRWKHDDEEQDDDHHYLIGITPCS